MKRIPILHIYLHIVCVGFAACGGDDDPEPEPEKPFTWNGDWNDPNDSHYEKYQGKYNPIEGDWQLLKDPNIRIIFRKDFVMNRAIYDVDYKIWKTSVWAESYAINDIGIKYTHSNALSIDEYKIVKENDIEYLYCRYQLPIQNEWKKYKRYTEN